MRALIERIKQNIPEYRAYDEAATRNSIILPILSKLGWDIFSRDSVYPEYPVFRRNREPVSEGRSPGIGVGKPVVLVFKPVGIHSAVVVARKGNLVTSDVDVEPYFGLPVLLSGDPMAAEGYCEPLWAAEGC